MPNEQDIIEACYKKLEVAIGYAESIEDSPDYRTALEMLKDAAIAALRQMKQEPCEWCKYYNAGEMVSEKLVNGYETELLQDVKFCPNCGRNMKGE